MQRRLVLIHSARAALPVVASFVGAAAMTGCASPPAPVITRPPQALLGQAQAIGQRAWLSDAAVLGVPVWVDPPARALKRARQRYVFGLPTLASHPDGVFVEMLCWNATAWRAEDTYLVVRWQTLAGPQSRVFGPLTGRSTE